MFHIGPLGLEKMPNTVPYSLEKKPQEANKLLSWINYPPPG
jgi:hypothetical protein